MRIATLTDAEKTLDSAEDIEVYFYMLGQVIAKVDGNTKKIKESYVYGNGERILTRRYGYDEQDAMSTTEEYNFTDIQGSLVMTADALTGAVTSRTKYDPYGNLLWANIQHQSSNISEDRYSYTGKEMNAETGLVYFGARWYDGDTGRFVSTDPISIMLEEPVNINKYQYCADNPIKYIDRHGGTFISVIAGLGGFLRGMRDFLSKKDEEKTILSILNGLKEGKTVHGMAEMKKKLSKYMNKKQLSIEDAETILKILSEHIPSFATAIENGEWGWGGFFIQGDSSTINFVGGTTSSGKKGVTGKDQVFVRVSDYTNTVRDMFHEVYENAFQKLFNDPNSEALWQTAGGASQAFALEVEWITRSISNTPESFFSDTIGYLNRFTELPPGVDIHNLNIPSYFINHHFFDMDAKWKNEYEPCFN
ncbi:RHS repeat-associated core domain-containing protein [bacterium]|nr:RHS repeat-associated core domain-containing protein [bacterium]